MRIADIAFLAGLLAVSGSCAAAPLRPLGWQRRLVCCAVLAGMVLVQILFRRLYWQLLPAGAGCVALAFACMVAGRTGTFSFRLTSLAAMGMAATSFAFLLALPLFRLPRPAGPRAVGTRIVHLIDPGRADSDSPGGRRELMVQVWYPTDSLSQPTAPYRRWQETTAVSSYDAFLKTHSHLNAPISRRGGPHPVLLFNPAWGGSRTQNTYQMEYLASFGYVVIAVDHTHNSSLVAFPDGQVVKAAPVQSIDDFTDSSFEKQMNIADQELDAQARDDSFVLDAFAAMNLDPDSSWFRTLDMERVGAFGHSFGGATSVETCFRDPRVRAALNMDGWMYGEIGREPLAKPLFVMYEQGWPPNEKELTREAHSNSPTDEMGLWDLRNLMRTLSRRGGYLLTIEKTKHMNFSDRSLYSPIRRFTDSGSIDPALAHRIINEYTLAFFDQTLRGKHEPLLNQSSQPYSLARFAQWTAPPSNKGDFGGKSRDGSEGPQLSRREGGINGRTAGA